MLILHRPYTPISPSLRLIFSSYRLLLLCQFSIFFSHILNHSIRFGACSSLICSSFISFCYLQFSSLLHTFFFQVTKALQIRKHMILHVCQIFHILLELFISFAFLVIDPTLICKLHFIVILQLTHNTAMSISNIHWLLEMMQLLFTFFRIIYSHIYLCDFRRFVCLRITFCIPFFISHYINDSLHRTDL